MQNSMYALLKRGDVSAMHLTFNVHVKKAQLGLGFIIILLKPTPVMGQACSCLIFVVRLWVVSVLVVLAIHCLSI